MGKGCGVSYILSPNHDPLKYFKTKLLVSTQKVFTIFIYYCLQEEKNQVYEETKIVKLVVKVKAI